MFLFLVNNPIRLRRGGQGCLVKVSNENCFGNFKELQKRHNFRQLGLRERMREKKRPWVAQNKKCGGWGRGIYLNSCYQSF